MKRLFCRLVVLSLGAWASPASATDYFWNNAAGGDWSELTNWKLGSAGAGGDPTVLPSESDTVYFCQGTYVISLTDDVRVYKTFIENQDGKVVRNVTFELNGHKLVSVDSQVVSGDRDHAKATMTFRGGRVDSESSVLAAKADHNAWTGYLVFDDVTVCATNNVGWRGSYSSVIITNGTKIACSVFGGQARRIAKTLDLTGANTKVSATTRFDATGPHRMSIAGGAWVILGRDGANSGDFNLNGYEQDYEAAHKTGAHVVIDNAVVTNIGFNGKICIGTSSAENSARIHDCVLTLTNNARAVSFGNCYIGGYQNAGGGVYYPCYSNRLEILDGSLMDLNGLQYAGSRTCDGMNIGKYSFSFGNCCYVNNGTYSSRFLTLGNTSVSGNYCATNNMLHIAGTHPLVKTITEHGTGKYSLAMYSGSILRFDIGKDGYSNVPLQVGGTLKVGRPNDATYTAFNNLSNRIVVAAREFDRAHPEERLTLIETKNDSTAAFQELIDNATFVTRNPGSLAIENSGKKLVYTAPKKPGMVLLFR